MTEQTKSQEVLDEVGSDAGGDQQTVEQLQAELKLAQAEAAKYRKQKTDIAKERDELKGKVKVDPQEENYKQLWQESQDKATKAMEKMKNSDIKSAVLSKLPAVGVKSEALEAALKLIDGGLIEWSEDDGVDSATVTAAIQQLKRNHSFLFESVVQKKGGITPKDGNSSAKTITREEFDQMMATNPAAWSAKRKEGYSVA